MCAWRSSASPSPSSSFPLIRGEGDGRVMSTWNTFRHAFFFLVRREELSFDVKWGVCVCDDDDMGDKWTDRQRRQEHERVSVYGKGRSWERGEDRSHYTLLT